MRIQTFFFLAVFAASASAHAADRPKLCELLPPPAAAALYGAPLQAPLDVGLACIYSHAGGGNINVHLNAIDGAPAGLMAQAYPKTLHKDYATDTVDIIPGLGEQARFIASTDKSTLDVLYHNMIFTIIVDGSKNPKLKEGMLQFAKQALPKL